MSSGLPDIKIDLNNLYREESYTDLKVASIRHLTPIKADGSLDKSRESMFIASTNVMSPMGPVPINATLEGKTLAEAVLTFPEAIKEAMERMVEEAREMQRQESSRIVVPDAATAAAAQSRIKLI